MQPNDQNMAVAVSPHSLFDSTSPYLSYRKNQRKRGTKKESTPAEGKEKWALKSLGITSCDEVEEATTGLSRVAGSNEPTRNHAQLCKKSASRWKKQSGARGASFRKGSSRRESALFRVGTWSTG